MPRSLSLTLLLLLAAAPDVLAQFETAALAGTVTDGSGAVIADATMSVTNTETGVTQTRQTGANGGFEFNRSSVVVPIDPSQPFGDAPRNSVRGPLFWQVDLAVSRRLPMPWPAGAVELRAELFNLLNRTNFRAPSGNRSAAAFGTITSTYDARQAQLGLKVSF